MHDQTDEITAVDSVIIDIDGVSLTSLDDLESEVLAEALRRVLDPDSRCGDGTVVAWDSSF